MCQIVNANSGCGECVTMPVPSNSSRGEDEVAEYLAGLGLSIKRRDRTVIAPYELDVLLLDHNLAVEFNGVYWHSEAAGRGRRDHYDKWRRCRDAGIQLLTVWEDDWRERRSVVESMLAHKLDLSPAPGGARSTTVAEVSAAEATRFLGAHHIQKAVAGDFHLGLRDHLGDLVAVSVWTVEGEDLRLDRYAASEVVPGGLIRLLDAGWARALSEGLSRIVTEVDHEAGDGAEYAALGFTAEAELDPDYTYLVGARRVSRDEYGVDRFRDDPALDWEEGLPEWELADLNGLPRIWDSGRTRWILEVVF